MRRTKPLRSFTDRPGYGDKCAVCPFCGKINDSAHPETQCHHFVQWNTHESQVAGATFTDSPRQEKREREKREREKQEQQRTDGGPAQ